MAAHREDVLSSNLHCPITTIKTPKLFARNMINSKKPSRWKKKTVSLFN
jgi:hypothetical protein